MSIELFEHHYCSQHLLHLPSADAGANQSSIEILWQRALNCLSVTTDPTHLASNEADVPPETPTTEDELNAETRLFCNSESYDELCIILFSSLNTSS